MLTITVLLGEEGFDESTNRFVDPQSVTVDLEHSLVSLSKWESIFKKPFLSDENKTEKEVRAYIKAMCLDPNVPDNVFDNVTAKNIDVINAYISDPMTATWFAESLKDSTGRRVITNELIYFWMFSLQIPLPCENWHLNRLFTLIRVYNEENAPKKKLTPAELAARNRALNAQRKAQMKTSG